MKIEIKKHDKLPKAVFVDGELWGSFSSESLGPRGVSYVLHDSARQGVKIPSGEHWKGSNRRDWTEAKVYSDALYNDARTRDTKNPEPFVPLPQRLVDLVNTSISGGWLIGPEAIRARAAKERTEREAREARHADERKRRFDKQIDKAVGGLRAGKNLTTEDMEGLRERIFEAMDWAQAQ